MSKSKGILYIEDCTECVIGQSGDMERAVENQEVCNALLKLDNKIRLPLTLKYIQGFTAQEISEIMAVNINTVKSRLNFGKGKLRKLLAGFYTER